MPKPSSNPVRRKPATPTTEMPPKTPTKGRADLASLRRTSEAEISRTSPAELRALPDDLLARRAPGNFGHEAGDLDPSRRRRDRVVSRDGA